MEKIETEIWVIVGPHVYCKEICDRALNYMLLHYHPIHAVPFSQ
jgi:hypothetical protein